MNLPLQSVSPERRRKFAGLVVLAIVALAVLALPLPLPSAPPADRHFHLQASSFAYQPAVLHVNRGDRVTIEIEAQDVVHGLYLDGYDLQVTAEPGRTAALSFTADRSGSFRFRCPVTCGPLHPFMIGQLKVGPNTLLWKGLALAALAALAGVWSLRR